MFSIDQNCHSLWDTIPKLCALAAAGRPATHFIEDVDTAFTAVGADADSPLHFARERYYRGGSADWGAALFYMPVLSALPVDVQQWEPLTGLSTAALARKLGMTVDDLYDRYSPGGTQQLIGPSFVGDRGQGLHRVIGDLRARETEGFIRQLLALAREDMLAAFPHPPCRDRLRDWFDRETAHVNAILDATTEATLVEVYEKWMALHVPAGKLDRSSRLFACDETLVGRELLEVFTRDYDQAAALYNDALTETEVGLRPLHTAVGELPMFACMERDGHLVRTNVSLDTEGLRIADEHFDLLPAGRLPLRQMSTRGVRALAGKAVLLACQVRCAPTGRPLALPYQGSLYVPASHCFLRKLRSRGLWDAPVHPIVRVRLHWLDRLTRCDVPIRLPQHLAGAFGREEISSRHLGRQWADVASEAITRLERFRTATGREQWQQSACGDLVDTIAALEDRRRQLASRNAPPEELRPVGAQIRPLEVQLLRRTLDRIAADWQLQHLNYWDSRGAILPWSLAIGGQEFYHHVVAHADIYEETPETVA